MLTSWKSMCCAMVLGLSTLAPALRAETPEEIAQLAQKGLGEDVQMAAVERTSGFALTADQIIKLKEAGVSDKVIAAMLRKKAGAVPVAPANPNLVIGAAPVPAGADKPADGTLGLVSIENVDDRSWGYRFDATNKVLWMSPVDQNTPTVIQAHGGQSFNVPAGNYDIRYTGEGIGAVFSVSAGDKTLVLFSRVENSDFEGLYASVFEKGERKGGGRLAILRQGGKGPTFQQVPQQQAPQQQPAPVAQTQPVPTYTTQAQPAPTYTYEQPQTQTQIVEEPSTTVIYRDAPVVYTQPGYPVYYPGYPGYYSRYHGTYYPTYSPYYPARPGVSIGVGGGGHHTGWGVGFGF